MNFAWNDRNVDHIGKHGIRPHEAEYVVKRAKPPYPQMIGEDKRIVIGQVADGRYLQVIYVPSRSHPDAVYVVHARPLTDQEKRKLRKRRR